MLRHVACGLLFMLPSCLYSVSLRYFVCVNCGALLEVYICDGTLSIHVDVYGSGGNWNAVTPVQWAVDGGQLGTLSSGWDWWDIICQRGLLWIDMPLGPVSVLWLLLAIVAYGMHRRRRREAAACRSCGYDLTGNVSGTCPECGAAVPEDLVRRGDGAGQDSKTGPQNEQAEPEP